ncbi:MAG: GNAT family N-acetyltransferase [Anaerolineales bacterium]|nr:GNAT family N-acetyltransferase [Anaerolineales bacterium]
MQPDSACLDSTQPAAPVHHPHRSLTDAPSIVMTVYGPEARPTGFEVLAAEWNPLLQRSRFESFFLTHEWQTTWWAELGRGDLWIVAFRNSVTGCLVGIAPLYHSLITEGPDTGRPWLHLVGCLEVSDYLDLIVERGWEGPVFGAFATWLMSPDAPKWDGIDLCNLPEASLTYRDLPPLFAAAGCQTEIFQEDTAPQFALPRRYEDYLQEMVEKKQRHEIRRKQRRAEREAEIGLYLVGPEHVLEAEVDDFVALQRASREDKADFMTPEMRRFFSAVARRMLDAGHLRLFFLTINGEKAAALFAFEYDRRFWLYTSGYDPAAYAQLSPGWVLLGYIIQYAIASGCRANLTSCRAMKV